MRVISGLVGVLMTACAAAGAGAQSLVAVPYVTGLSQPVGLVPHPSDPQLQYVLEKAGRIRVIERGVLRPEVFLDLAGHVAATGEQGLLGLAFDPEYATNRRFWVNFTREPDGHTVVARFVRDAVNPYAADVTSRLDLEFEPGERFIRQPAANHNGGMILFGPDGYLYLPMGDGGGANDAYRHAQHPASLLGKILRIDVRVPDQPEAPGDPDADRGYRIPPDNPFVRGTPIEARPEIWAFGVRNPWRVAFDEPRLGGTGGLFIADVGQWNREEVSYQPAGAGGRNYGWPILEGTLVNQNAPQAVQAAYQPLTAPIVEYDHQNGFGRSITGGHRYRGALLGPTVKGRYVFGDIENLIHHIEVSFDVATAQPTGRDLQTLRDVAPAGAGLLVSIDADLHGELFLVYLGGTIFRLTTTNDSDGNGLDDTWEALFHLPALGTDAGGPFGDPNGDGVINAEAFRRGLHPTGQPIAYFAEGATGFFTTRISLLNDGETTSAAVAHWQTADGREATHTMPLGARRVGVADASTQGGLPSAEFATRIIADGPLVASRTMTWQAGASPHGSHSERGLASPGTVWYFAEGATTAFELFYLVQNASSTQTADVQIEYLVAGQGARASSALVPAGGRRTIWVNQVAGLSSAELGATFTSANGVPIVVERAMYTRGASPVFPAGHAVAGEPTLSVRWFFAEGATGSYFDTFLAVANPYDTPLDVEYRVYLPDGSTTGAPLRFRRTAAPRERLTIWLDQEVTDEGVSLAAQGGLSVELTAARPFIAERAMWWPGSFATWHEGHASTGFAEEPAAQWRLAGGEVHMPPYGVDPPIDTYLLLANLRAVDEAATVTVYFTDRDPVDHPIVIPAGSRFTLALSGVLRNIVPDDARVDIGLRVTAVSPDAQLYAEQAVYGTARGGPRWSRGAAHRGSK